MSAEYGLLFAWGPTPANPDDARALGAEESQLLASIQASEEVVFLYCHRASLPELVALVRAVGRDCTIGPFAERWAWIRVHAMGGAP